MNTCLEEKALTLFRSFKENDLYYDDAQWFLALTHLKMNNFKATKTQLHNLTHRPNLYSLKAKKLLHDIIHEKK